MPIIERSGQIIQVDYFMYQQVFQFISERIAEGKLDYEKMLNREIERLEKNIKELNEMDKKY